MHDGRRWRTQVADKRTRNRDGWIIAAGEMVRVCADGRCGKPAVDAAIGARDSYALLFGRLLGVELFIRDKTTINFSGAYTMALCVCVRRRSRRTKCVRFVSVCWSSRVCCALHVLGRLYANPHTHSRHKQTQVHGAWAAWHRALHGDAVIFRVQPYTRDEC